MKGLLLGLALIITSALSTYILKDATICILLIPMGIISIVEWIKNGDRIFKEDF